MHFREGKINIKPGGKPWVSLPVAATKFTGSGAMGVDRSWRLAAVRQMYCIVCSCLDGFCDF